jgi:ribonuclease R
VAQHRDKVFPNRDAIVAFIRTNPGNIGTREIAREFGLKNADRVELKRILRELSDEGTIAKHGRKLQEPHALPSTVIADITGRDRDGELIAAPVEWDEENGDAPKIRIHVPRRPQPGTAAGVGDRALLRIEKSDTARARFIAAASSRSSITPKAACSESSGDCPTAADGWCRSTRSRPGVN